MKTWRSDSLL